MLKFTDSLALVLVLFTMGCRPTSYNVILFYADDLGWKDLSIQGSDYYQTPYIDKIAAEGMRFRHAYSNAPNCAPSRACLMTGLYTPRHGIYTVSNAARGESINRKLIPVENKTRLDSTFTTLPHLFKEKGYQTAIAGKWHLSENATDYGFDANFGGHHRGAPRSYFAPYQNPQLPDGPEGEYLPERLCDEAKKWISDHSEHPFFFYYPFYLVHTPIQPKESLEREYENIPKGVLHDNAAYAAMVAAMDLAVGEIIQLLEELRIKNNTLVIFTSDNGPMGAMSVAKPLRGSKGMLYEGGIRVPLLVQWPGVIQPGSTNDEPVIGSDLFATLADLLGLDQAKSDGVSLLPLFRGRSFKPRPLYWHFPAYLEMYDRDRAFEDSHDKPHFRTSPVGAVRSGSWKLLQFFEEDDLELYNLKDDPGEQIDLAEKQVEIRDSLLQTLMHWRREVGAPVPRTKNPEYRAGGQIE